MFNFKPSDEKSGLEKEIDVLLLSMRHIDKDSEQYAKMVDQLNVLYKLKEVDIPKRVSPDTLAIVAGNLLGIILIVGHEKAHVVTSKALNFVLKLR
jgi:hypothetical protein